MHLSDAQVFATMSAMPAGPPMSTSTGPELIYWFTVIPDLVFSTSPHHRHLALRAKSAGGSVKRVKYENYCFPNTDRNGGKDSQPHPEL